MNILHISDVHLGAKFATLGEKGGEQRERLAGVFKKIPQLAASNNVKLVVIPGDLFDSPYPASLQIDVVKSVIDSLLRKGICVAISAGTHDYLAPGSIYLSDTLKIDSELLHIFDKPRPSMHIFTRIGVCVSARSLDSNRSHTSPFADLNIDNKVGVNIAMAHGSVLLPGLKIADDDWPIKLEDIQSSNFSYVALGHWHSMKEIVKGKAWYCGSPEWVDIDQRGSGSVLIVSVEKTGTVVSPISVGSTMFDKIEIDTGVCLLIETLKNKILVGANKNLIRKVVLKGIRPKSLVFDVRQLESELSSNFLSLTIEDQSVLRVDKSVAQEDTVVGRFVKKMEEKISSARSENEKKEIEEAMWIGAKLLKGEEAGL